MTGTNQGKQMAGKRTKSESESVSIGHLGAPSSKRRRLNSSFCGTTEMTNDMDTGIMGNNGGVFNSIKNYMGIYQNFLSNDSNTEEGVVKKSGGIKFFVKIY